MPEACMGCLAQALHVRNQVTASCKGGCLLRAAAFGVQVALQICLPPFLQISSLLIRWRISLVIHMAIPISLYMPPALVRSPLSMLQGSTARGVLCGLFEALSCQAPEKFRKASSFRSGALSQKDSKLMHECKLPFVCWKLLNTQLQPWFGRHFALAMLSICCS